jgi:hypothetical protein
MQIFSELKIVVEVRKNQNGKIDSGIQKREFRFLELPTPIVHLELALNHVRVCNFAASLKILRQLKKTFAFVSGFLRRFELALRCPCGVITLHNCNYKTSRSNLRASTSCSSGSRSTPSFREPRDVDNLVYISLTEIFMHCVVRDEPHGGARPIALCVDHGVVVAHAGQQAGDRLFLIFVCDASFSDGTLVRDIDFSRTIQRIL